MLTPQQIKDAILPLRLIFWGGLICIFDITFSQTVNGEGFKIDLLDDAVGMLLIAIGVFKLSAIEVQPRYATAMTFVKVVSVLALIDAVREHFITRWPELLIFMIQVLGLLELGAIVVFCVCMRWFCEAGHLDRAAASWQVTMWLFVVIYAIPLGFLYLAVGVAIATGTSFHIDLGPAGLLLLPIFAIPIVHLFVSTSRMKRGAEETFDGSSPQ